MGMFFPNPIIWHCHSPSEHTTFPIYPMLPPFPSSFCHWTRPTLSNLFVLWDGIKHSQRLTIPTLQLQLNIGSTGRGALGSMFNFLRDIPIVSGFGPSASPWNGPLVPGFVGMGRTPQSCHKSIKMSECFTGNTAPKFRHQMDQLQCRSSEYLGNMLIHKPREVLPSP